MQKEKIRSDLTRFRAWRAGSSRTINKPILLLLALARCHKKRSRLATLREYEAMLHSIGGQLSGVNLVYPFGRLVKDGLWEIEQERNLTRSSSGDLSKRELNELGIRGGLRPEIYDALYTDPALTEEVFSEILTAHIPIQHHEDITSILLIARTNSISKDRVPSNAVKGSNAVTDTDNREVGNMDQHKQNSFIAYLNSLHNVGASGANAIAESQALNVYFSELYEPFPIVNTLYDFLSSEEDRVILLTGHAGDGKSTVALDLIKRLKRLAPEEALEAALNEREDIPHPSKAERFISIVKDMSELSAERRLQWLDESFSEPGSWLIVSNTGPLLNSLSEFSRCRHVPGNMNSKILELLNREYSDSDLDSHILKIFPKDLLILNMTQLDNISLGARILLRMINHSGWSHCEGCVVASACPVLLNRMALKDLGSVVSDRVRWVYQRLNAYEQRLTLRQIVAHMAFAISGGMGCAEAKQLVDSSGSDGLERGSDGLERILFSEAFFGYRAGKPCQAAGNLRAVKLIERQVFGSPVGVDFERELEHQQGSHWASLPDPLSALYKRWSSRTKEAEGVQWRFAKRRMLYIFGKPSRQDTSNASTFFDSFLQSPRLRDFDQWSLETAFSLSSVEQKRLCRACLRVLLEVFSGFSSGQFQADHDRLFLTLRRPDRAVVQPTQLVMATLPFDDFRLYYDRVRRFPVLRYKNSDIALRLTLPLLDFIERRSAGDLGSELSEIHLAQLEWFRAELLRLHESQNRQSSSTELNLLKANISGEVFLRRYHLDLSQQILEVD
ncbi:MAG: hypothetical protein KFB96_04540 [Thiocapsa sp.]|uniref:hypothetical protein n=1 Tax=Thiocapsa sp. TaxID=2024551 RepID=UPI001BCF16ED|nr:hypothetical protein [Thiocapsa sp.]QVL49769.1 MAG: hypothetical protein KFB96_04540 [Thiocapsa sp.]